MDNEARFLQAVVLIAEQYGIKISFAVFSHLLFTYFPSHKGYEF